MLRLVNVCKWFLNFQLRYYTSTKVWMCVNGLMWETLWSTLRNQIALKGAIQMQVHLPNLNILFSSNWVLSNVHVTLRKCTKCSPIPSQKNCVLITGWMAPLLFCPCINLNIEFSCLCILFQFKLQYFRNFGNWVLLKSQFIYRGPSFVLNPLRISKNKLKTLVKRKRKGNCLLVPQPSWTLICWVQAAVGRSCLFIHTYCYQRTSALPRFVEGRSG